MVVVGSGAIGHGVAQILAVHGYEVMMLGVSEDHLRKSVEKIRINLDKLVEKKKIVKEQADLALKRIGVTTSYKRACEGIDFAIEAVPENLEVKRQVFASLDSFAPSKTIFASATSALSITEIGEVTKRPEKTSGMHFFNPPQQMALVEIIKGAKTSQETVNALTSLALSLGKKAIVVRKDVRGSIVNRILYAVFLEAFWAYHRKEATKEGIDASVKYKGGFPMGWFELADFAGLDIVNEVGKNLYKAYNGRFEPCLEVLAPLLKENKFGQKTGMGFYDWTNGRPIIPSNLQDCYDVGRSWVVAINEAAWLVNDDAASPADIDVGMRLGTYWPSGPCEQADRIGLDVTAKKLEELYSKFKLQIYKPCPLLEEYVSKGWTGKKAGRGFY